MIIWFSSIVIPTKNGLNRSDLIATQLKIKYIDNLLRKGNIVEVG